MDFEDILTRSNTVQDALRRFNASGGQMLLLVDRFGAFERVVTQGDIRRVLLDGCALGDTLELLPLKKSVYVHEGAPFSEVEKLFAAHKIDQIPILDAARRPVGLHNAQDFKPILLSTPHLGDDELKFVNEAFDTNWIAPVGPNLDGFERAITDYTGSGHAVALSSGTAAIHLGLIALGVVPGDTVLCSALTFAASANPIRYQGATPVFVDSEPDTWNMSPLALQAAIDDCLASGVTPRAMVVVNLYGQSADMDPLLEIAHAHGIPILEDAAESLGATYKGRASGTFGRIGVFSFNGNKIITTSGGGALVTDDKAIADKVRYLSTQAREPVLHYEHREIGYNYRLSNVLAGIGRGQFQVLDERVRKRREIFSTYHDWLGGIAGLSFMPEPDGYHSTRWLSVMRVGEDSGRTPLGLIAHLANHGIEARPLWKPMHRQSVFADCPYFTHGHNQSVSDVLFEEGVCLPSGTNNLDGDIERVVDVIQRYCTA